MMRVFMNHLIFMKLWKDISNHTVIAIQMMQLKFQLTISICKQSVKLRNAMSNCILNPENKILNKDFTFVFSL